MSSSLGLKRPKGGRRLWNDGGGRRLLEQQPPNITFGDTW
jgi:hypothetical protein